jgi:hypothetical protein
MWREERREMERQRNEGVMGEISGMRCTWPVTASEQL